MMFRAWVMGAALALAANAGWAKLPPPTEEQKAKAEETKAKAAENAKKDAEALGKSQDQVAERYIKLMKEKGVDVRPTPIVPPAPPAAAAPVPSPATVAPAPAPAAQAAAPAEKK